MGRIVSILLVTSLCISFVAPLVPAQNPIYKRGYEDGKRAANQDVESVKPFTEALWGALLGPIPVVHALVTESKVPSSRLRGIDNRNREYREGFKQGYKDTVQQTTLLSRIGGWAGWLIIWVVGFK